MLRAVTSKIKSSFFGDLKTPNHQIDPEDYTIVQEGQARILFPKQGGVFYNPVQQFNRDLSVTCIKAWDNLYASKQKNISGKKRPASEGDIANKQQKLSDGSIKSIQQQETVKPYIRILEALSATGLRAIRYANEVPHVKEIIANDLLPDAVDSIRRNVEHNNVEHLVKPNLDDANALMHNSKARKTRYHVIDLDPYGTVAPFADAAIQSIEDDGLMLVTCTDLSVLAGNGYPEKCFALYGGVNMVSHEATHESALRLVLNLLNQTAAKYGKVIEPLLSLSIDFYVRVFIKVKRSPIAVKRLQSNTMITYHCSQCGSYHNQHLGRQTEKTNKQNKTVVKFNVAQGPPVDRKCQFCGGTFHLAGPMYAGPLHSKEFVQEVLRINRKDHRDSDSTYGTRKRIEGMLTLAINEISDAPFYFSPNHIASVLKFQVPPLKKVVAGLGSLGYECSLTHAQPSSLKTNAPWNAIWYVMKECHEGEFNLEKMNHNATGYKILANTESWKPSEEIISKLSFEPHEQSGHVERLRKLKIVRYQENPTKNWGPKARP